MESIGTWWMWAGFTVLVIVALIVDLLVMRQQGAHRVSFREALQWSMVWIALALAFNAALWWYLRGAAGPEVANTKGLEFLTGYLVEKSLAVDNIFVFLMIFNFFAVPNEYQKRALIWGVIGAIVLRALMILLGAFLIAKFHWIFYLFGAFLVITGIKMATSGDDKPDLEQNPIIRWVRKHMKIATEFDGEKMITIRDGVRYATPLLLVIVMIGITDVIFAVDSIPAIFAITTDPFIVLTSNVFAILGLRAMYFMLADMADRFHFLNYGLAAVLCFIGVKMLIMDLYKIPIAVSLGTVFVLVAGSMVASLLIPAKPERV
ncbi:MAG: TerC family protein [Xanthomonadales bacterium]|nr:TerC family protein [Xanthomonadales bacterium]MCP5473623.1 TerC family protein [Rhodanobacteraceae bacterium]